MEFNKTQKISVVELQLDDKNPRLVEQFGQATEEAIIAWLSYSADLDELLQSISTNGYLDIEPLVATCEENNWVVLEGNRRLAALRLLRDPSLAARINEAEGTNIKVPDIDESLRNTLEEVSVYCVENRQAARSFIGFKHINGPVKWDAYAKARFAADWYKKEKSQGTSESLKKISRAIGDRHDTIKRMVSAIYILDQARTNNLFSIEDRKTPRFSFSHLYTALGRTQYMQYLGLASTWAQYDPEPNPVPPDKLADLKQLLIWMYGSKAEEIEPIVLSQNPDIKRLGEVLVHVEGMHVLNTTGRLDDAYAVTEPVDRRFTASLLRARDEVKNVAGSLRAYDGRDTSLLDVAEDVKETAETVHQRMQKKHQAAIDEE